MNGSLYGLWLDVHYQALSSEKSGTSCYCPHPLDGNLCAGFHSVELLTERIA